MPLDPSVIAPNTAVLQSIANPPPIPTIADIQAKQLALQNARLQSQGLTADLQQKDLERQQQAEVIQAFHDSGGDAGKAIQDLYSRGNPAAFKLQQDQLAIQKLVDDHKKTALDNAAHNADMLGRAASSVQSAPPDHKATVYQFQKGFLEQNGLVPKGQLPDTYDPAMEPQFQTWIDNAQSAKDAAQAAKDKAETQGKTLETATKQRTDALNTLSSVKSDADYQTQLANLKSRGVPDNVLAEFQGAWTPERGAQLENLARSPAERMEAPVKQTAATFARAKLASEPLTQAAAQGPAAYAAALPQQPPDVQNLLRTLGPNATPAQVFRALLPDDEQYKFDHMKVEEQQKRVELALEARKTAATETQARLAGMYIPSTPNAQNLHGEEFLATLPSAAATQIRQIANGEQDAPSLNSRNPMAGAVLQAVNQFDPTFNDNRKKTMVAYATGAPSQPVNAINTAIGHLQLLDEAGQALKNGSFVPGNAVYNRFVTMFGKPEATNVKSIVQRVSGELNKATGSVGEGEQEAIKQNLSGDLSPDGLHGAVQTNIHLLGEAMDTHKQAYMRGTGFTADNPKVRALLTPRAKSALAAMGFDENMQPITPPANIPTGATKQLNKKTGQWRYSTDGGKSWQIPASQQ